MMHMSKLIEREIFTKIDVFHSALKVNSVPKICRLFFYNRFVLVEMKCPDHFLDVSKAQKYDIKA